MHRNKIDMPRTKRLTRRAFALYAALVLVCCAATPVLAEGDPLTQFRRLGEDIDKLALASYFAEVTEKTVQEGEVCPDILSLLLNCLYALDTLDKPLEQVKAVFQLRLLTLTGLAPLLDTCVVCGNPQPEEPRLHLLQGVLHCAACRTQVGDGVSMPLSPAALAAARLLGAGEQAVRRGLAEAVVRGRVEPAAVGAPFTVLIDYAHNEAAAESLLRTLRAYKPARLIAVFGCGGDRSRLRRFGMGSVCARLADFCVITEDNSRTEPVEQILADIRAGLRLGNPATPFAEIPDRRQAIYYALDHAQPGDIIAILGKGHETTIERNGVKEPFVEREIVEEYWEVKKI